MDFEKFVSAKYDSSPVKTILLGLVAFIVHWQWVSVTQCNSVLLGTNK